MTDPINAEWTWRMAASLVAGGQTEQAIESFGRIPPDHALFVQAQNNRGVLLSQLGRREEALAAFEAARLADQNFAPALNNQGGVLNGLGRFEEALVLIDRALVLAPDFVPAHQNRGAALIGLERFGEALASLELASPGGQASLQVAYLRAGALVGVRRFEEAVAAYDAILTVAPQMTDAIIDRAHALEVLGRFDEAIAAFEQCLPLRPDIPYLRNNQAFIHLRLGDFAQGWRLMESRKIMPTWHGLYPSGREWAGEDLTGKTLFVHWEQGLGDTLQFCRYLPLLIERGAKVVFSCQDRLRRLTQTLAPDLEVIGEGETPPAYDFHTPLMSMPFFLGGEIPAKVPYLRADPERAVQWKKKLSGEGFKIGVAWRGSQHCVTQGYAFTPADLAPLKDIPGARLICLQLGGEKEPGARDLGLELLGDDLDAGPDAFIDTAAILENLDLLVTPDTSLAHLAGSLGRPTFIGLSRTADWRWRLEGQDSAWYPSLKLFRQTRLDDWSGVFQAMRDEITLMAKRG